MRSDYKDQLPKELKKDLAEQLAKIKTSMNTFKTNESLQALIG